MDALKILRCAQMFSDQAKGIEETLWFGSPPPASPEAQTITEQQIGYDPSQKPQMFTDPTLNPGRQRVIQVALSQVGQGAGEDWRKYLQGTVSAEPPGRISWCGIFVTWVLQQAGLTSAQWQYGKGISSILGFTNNPKPGDVIYMTKNQHHGIIERIDGNTVHTIDGNSRNGVVARNARSKSDISAYYSIGPLVGETA